jgi:hypothetical protein
MSDMRRTAILFAVVVALAVRPLQLPAASCIPSNAPSQENCKPNCCANKRCCALSKKSNVPVSQPLYQSVDAKQQQQVVGFIAVAGINWPAPTASAQPTSPAASVRAHSPPPLAASCIRLI